MSIENEYLNSQRIPQGETPELKEENNENREEINE
jgi:hypothetical protein